LVLDEADTMLDMGFIHDIKKIIKLLPEKRQSLFFSATMPDSITQLAATILTDPVRVEVARVSSAAETVHQQVFFACQKEKRDLLVEILQRPEVETALVFTRTKHGADKVVRYINKAGIKAEAIHGNKSQPQRDRAMNGFRQGKINVLVATDIAARGIDVDALSHVINFEIPNISETYVHRIGRTGRAGLQGHAISLCNEDEERDYLRDIQKLIQKELPVERYGSYPIELGEVGMTKPRGGQTPKQAKPARNNNGGGGRNGGGRQQQPKGGSENGTRKPRPQRTDSQQRPARGEEGSKRRMGERREEGSGNSQAPRGRNNNRRRPAQDGNRNNDNRQRNPEGGNRNNDNRQRNPEGGNRNNDNRQRNPEGGNRNNGNRQRAEQGGSRNEHRKPRNQEAAPRQFGRSTTAPEPDTNKQKGFSLSSFFGFGKRED
jgi:ATP-dependent RNA helicase RhlE